ncbi:hypothetical protein MKW98_028783 [Papaver atlanticum]|uniref:Mannan endo-1,4-beta-mannosidase n=1 Tax=Papaver atlanticum TaxID=357466 RepID=A0AAD4S9R9_9MAGN|nr:hypothetical protein MKW98_028783 [Papaver atlanticum]
MQSVSCKWLLLSFLFLSWAHSALAVDGLRNGDTKVRGVNLGGWLVIEGFITPSLFKNIPRADMLDGAKVRFQSWSSNKYVSAHEGGDSGVVTVDRIDPKEWETFRLWRVSELEYQLRTHNGQFLSCDGEGASASTKSGSPSSTETFSIVRWKENKVHIKLSSGTYLQASSENELKADYPAGADPGWDDNNAAIFRMTFVSNMEGDYQLGNAYGREEAKRVIDNHRSSFVTQQDFEFLSAEKINTVRIPVGWWIKDDSKPEGPEYPYVGGSSAYLQKALDWAQAYEIKFIIDLHAAQGSQNGMDHSGSRDDSIEWPSYTEQTLEVIEFLASNYGKHPALLGIELLNEPHAPQISLDVLKPYYLKAYEIVRKYSLDTAYVIICQRLNTLHSFEIYNANELKGLSNLVVDFHFYNLYTDFFKNISPSESIQYINKQRRQQVDSLNAANGPIVFVGEWVNSFERSASLTEYQDLSKAQLEVYGSASFGWAYWTLKTETFQFQDWDLKKNIEKKILQLYR